MKLPRRSLRHGVGDGARYKASDEKKNEGLHWQKRRDEEEDALGQGLELFVVVQAVTW